MGLDESLPPEHDAIPRARVAIMTSDTTNVMPATARELQKYPLCEGMIWVPCTPHALNLYLVDQLAIPSFKVLLQHAKQIVTVFRSGAFHKIFLTFARDHNARLQLPVKVRWNTYSDMLVCLMRYQGVVCSAVLSDEYVVAAKKARRAAADRTEDIADEDDLEPLQECDGGMSDGLRGNAGLAGTGKYSAVFNDVSDPTFWHIMKEYVAINAPVCEAIIKLGSPSAGLSDAARALLEIDAHMRAATTAKYPALFGGTVSRFAIPELVARWDARYAAALTDHHMLALLLDMRPAAREFVSNGQLLGTGERGDRGNTPALHGARRTLDELAAVCVLDAQVSSAARASGPDKVLAAKRHILKSQLDVFLDVHPQHIPWSTLKIDPAALQAVSNTDSPLCFWQLRVPPSLSLRSVGQRINEGKTAGTTVERVFSHTGQVFTPRRRSLKSGRVAKLVYVKVNMHLLGDEATLEGLGVSQLNDPAVYSSMFAEAERLDDEDFVRSLPSAEVLDVPETIDDDADDCMTAPPEDAGADFDWEAM